MLKKEYGDHFAQAFQTVTVDNGSRLADFAQCEEWGTEVYFVHPFTLWKLAQNERHNGLLRAFVPKESPWYATQQSTSWRLPIN